VDILSWGGGEREKEEEEEKRNGLGHGDLGEEKGHARGTSREKWRGSQGMGGTHKWKIWKRLGRKGEGGMVHAQVMIQGSL
jgi:hypothetical protein